MMHSPARLSRGSYTNVAPCRSRRSVVARVVSTDVNDVAPEGSFDMQPKKLRTLEELPSALRHNQFGSSRQCG